MLQCNRIHVRSTLLWGIIGLLVVMLIGTGGVPNRPPLVTIDSPRDEMWFRPVETINLMGQAWDPEDGAIAEDDLV